ncbi:uncharacterized protein [Asterias amurensis]|uniref:uncharacterized protein n=1 Tax=Asterias amurensis TaxID=7602 RepID=UPI003AB557F5
MTTDQVADTVNHTRMKKKKKKLLQSGGQKLFEPTTSSTDEQKNCQDPLTKKKKHISERVQTENEEVRTFNGIQFPGSSEQSDGLSEIPKKKKKKKKTLKSYDQESITIEPKTPTDDQQSSQDQPKKKKRSKSERVQTENEEIPKKKKKKKKGVDALCDIESSLKINRQVWRGETVLTEMHVDKNLESAPTTLRKSKKRKRATSCKSDGQESVTIESETTAADENVSTEIKERVTLPSSKKRQPGSHERRKKKRQSGKDQVEDEEEIRGDSGLILRKRGEKERVFSNKKKKKAKEESRLHVKGGEDARGKVLECVPGENPSAADKKRVKRKRKRSVQSDGQESVTGKPRSSTTDENASVENSETVTDSVTDQKQQISQKRNRRRQRRKKKLMNNNEQVGEESRRVSGENSEELTDIHKKKKKKKTEDGRLNDAVKSAGLEENAQAGRGENVLTMQSNEAISNDDNLEIAFTVLKKKRKKKKRKQIVESTNEESVEPRTTDEDVSVEEAERLTLPLSEQNGRKKKKKRANGQIEKEVLRPVNGSILQASDEHLEGLTGITKKMKKTKKSVEFNEIANARRGESVLTDMQMNEPVSNDDNLEVKKRKRKKKRKQSVESIDQESINVEPQTTDQDLLIEENGLLKKKNIPSGQTEDEGELSIVNGSKLPVEVGLLEEITKKKKKQKKKATHATRDNSKLISQSDDNSVSEYSPNEVGQDSESDATDGETSEDITKKQKKKKKKKKKIATHATQDDSDQLNLKDNDNSVSEYSRNEASQDSESEGTDGESSSSDLSSDCEREDFRKLDISSLPWLVKSERGFFMQELIKGCPVLHTRNHYYEKEREALRKQGHTVKEGRWSGLEEARLRENLEKFCKAYGIEDPLVLLIPSRFGLSKEVRRFSKSTQMLVKLAEGIHRTLNTVYIRAFKLFDPWHLTPRFSKKELDKAIRLKKKYGHNWQYIGDRLQRSSESVRYRMKGFQEGGRKGKWLKFEQKQLYDAVMEITAPLEGHIDRFVNVPWKRVAEKVPTRCAAKCCHKWNSSLGWRFNERKKHSWQANDYIELLELVDASNVREECEIDWSSILEKLSDRVCSMMQLKTLWHKLKMKYAPNNFFMEYCDILDTLFEKALPALKVAAAEHEKVMAKRAAKQLKKNSKVYIISDSDEDSADDWM